MGIFDFFSKKNGDNGKPLTDQQLLEKIEVAPGLSIPRAFVPALPDIQKSRLSFISITATPKDDIALEQSKFGHYPYMPVDFEYPKDVNGQFMYPLAQVNCSEIPKLAGYPGSGYLQFYISAFDDVYGLDFDDAQSQTNFRVLYFEEKDIVQHKVDFSFLDEILTSDQVPVWKPHALSFALKDDYIGLGDVRESKHFLLENIKAQHPSIADELELSADDCFLSTGHKMGGYAYFTQTDPREYKVEFKHYILLFQMDSDDHILWGDVGVANFFIDPSDLAKKDFSRVVYNWDCG